MPGFTRRQFLKRSGVFVAVVGAAPAPSEDVAHVESSAALVGGSLGLPPAEAILGRAFRRAEVRLQASAESPLVGYLHPDSVHPLIGLSEDGWWYQLAEGMVVRDALQPITAYTLPPYVEANAHFEVIAPVTTIREFCSALANAVMRVPFGTVLFVQDHLIDDLGQRWYGISVDNKSARLLGWAPAAHLRHWPPPAQPVASQPAVWIDTQRQMLSAYDGEQLLGECAFTGPVLPPGAGALLAFTPSQLLSPPRPGTLRSRSDRRADTFLSWKMAFQPEMGEPTAMYAAPWHNDFGMPGGRDFHLPTFAARWLYSLVSSAPVGMVPAVMA